MCRCSELSHVMYAAESTRAPLLSQGMHVSELKQFSISKHVISVSLHCAALRLSITHPHSPQPNKKLVGVMLGCCTAQRDVQWSLLTEHTICALLLQALLNFLLEGHFLVLYGIVRALTTSEIFRNDEIHLRVGTFDSQSACICRNLAPGTRFPTFSP